MLLISLDVCFYLLWLCNTIFFFCEPKKTDQVTRQSTVLGQLSTASSSNASSPQTTEEPLPPSGLQLPQPQQETEDAEGSSLLVAPSILQNEAFSSPGQTGPSPSNCSLNTVVWRRKKKAHEILGITYDQWCWSVDLKNCWELFSTYFRMLSEQNFLP